MRWIAAFLMLSLASTTWAADVIDYDPSTGFVSRYERSVNVNRDQATSSKIIWVAEQDPEMLVLGQAIEDLRASRVPPRYWKIRNGRPQEMSQAEKDQVDAPTPEQVQAIADRQELTTLDSQRDADKTKLDDPLATANDLKAILKRELRRNELSRKLGGR